MSTASITRLGETVSTSADYKITLWTTERIAQGRKALSNMTPRELCVQRDPDVVEYILELRSQVEMWKRLYNQRLGLPDSGEGKHGNESN